MLTKWSKSDLSIYEIPSKDPISSLAFILSRTQFVANALLIKSRLLFFQQSGFYLELLFYLSSAENHLKHIQAMAPLTTDIG